MHCICCQQPGCFVHLINTFLLGFSVRIRSPIFASLSDVLLLLVHYYYCTYLDLKKPRIVPQRPCIPPQHCPSNHQNIISSAQDTIATT